MARAKISKIMGFPAELILRRNGDFFESDDILTGVVVESPVPSEIILILELPVSACIKFENRDNRKMFGPFKVLERREISVGCRFVKLAEMPKVMEFRLTVITEDKNIPHERSFRTQFIRFVDNC